MKFNWILRAADLEKKSVPFAIATVIDTVAPTSAKPMAKAIITLDGKMEGWMVEAVQRIRSLTKRCIA